jgi:predicted house-cleaning noncanonical NTP pyrophosphatase (MazG superfamily)
MNLENAMAYIKAMIDQAVTHKTKGYFLSDMKLDDQIAHLREEVQEIEDATSGARRREEIADALGVILHMAVYNGMSDEELILWLMYKLRVRFHEPTFTPKVEVAAAEITGRRRKELDDLRAHAMAMKDHAWLARFRKADMENKYNQLSPQACRDIASYVDKVLDKALTLPL